VSIFFNNDENRDVPDSNNNPILRTEQIPGPAGPAGAQGQQGDQGPQGGQGPQGNAGVGVPTGGTIGQVLAKKTSADFDTEWASAGSAIVLWGGITGTLSNQTDLQAELDAKAFKITAITAGNGLTGGGDFSASRTIAMLPDVPADSVNFNLAATEANGIGKMFWNSTEGAPQVGLAGGNVQLQIGSMVVAYVRNAETTTLAKGEVVYLFGASGNRAKVKRASNGGDPTSSKTMGIVAEPIAANQVGFIVTQGVIAGLSLGSPYTEGDQLYLGAVAGTFTRVKPVAPAHTVFLGVVERANAGNGQIYVKPQNGLELEELHDVLITSPTTGQTILWDGATSLWENTTITIGTVTGLSAELSAKVTAVAATSPILSSGGITPTISIPVATAVTSGYLTSADWITFNSKQEAGSYVTSVTSGTTGATQLSNMMQITAAGYNAITSPSANTLYIIVG
jgi:hypothetical protein